MSEVPAVETSEDGQQPQPEVEEHASGEFEVPDGYTVVTGSPSGATNRSAEVTGADPVNMRIAALAAVTHVAKVRGKEEIGHG